MSLASAFDETARERIFSAVTQAEQGTHGEIVPVVLARSEAYPEARYHGGLVGLLVGTLAAALLPHPAPLWEVVALQSVALALGFAVAGWDPLERLLVGRATLEEAVRARAQRAFFEHGVDRTQGRTGVLVLVSLFEHQVVVLPDEGVSAKVEPGAWKALTGRVAESMRQGRPVDAVCEAIAASGELLARGLPATRGEDNPNELADALRLPPDPSR